MCSNSKLFKQKESRLPTYLRQGNKVFELKMEFYNLVQSLSSDQMFLRPYMLASGKFDVPLHSGLFTIPQGGIGQFLQKITTQILQNPF